jgi:RNA-directed DNA polymerase
LVSGTKEHAEALKEEVAGVLSTMGLRLSPDKTLITHIDDGLDFLGYVEHTVMLMRRVCPVRDLG